MKLKRLSVRAKAAFVVGLTITAVACGSQTSLQHRRHPTTTTIVTVPLPSYVPPNNYPPGPGQ